MNTQAAQATAAQLPAFSVGSQITIGYVGRNGLEAWHGVVSKQGTFIIYVDGPRGSEGMLVPNKKSGLYTLIVGTKEKGLVISAL
jgi:hypothetical protein